MTPQLFSQGRGSTGALGFFCFLGRTGATPTEAPVPAARSGLDDPAPADDLSACSDAAGIGERPAEAPREALCCGVLVPLGPVPSGLLGGRLGLRWGAMAYTDVF